MSRLQQLQDNFQSALLNDNKAFNSEIVATEKVDIDTRIGIYSNAYRARLIEAMEDSFEAVHTLLGDDQFYELCNRYIDAHPSRHYSIRWFGHRLAEFTRDTAPYCDYPYISELADFQWKLMEAFDAADEVPVSSDDMAAVPADIWPELSFRFHPSIRRLDLKWSVPAFWRAVDEERKNIQPPKESQEAISWVIQRKELRQYFRSLAPAEAWALDKAMSGVFFAELCEGLLQWKSEDDAAMYAAQLLRRWIGEHMITAIRTPE